MANHINMGEREAITRLYEGGWKKRRIARELGLDRKTVRRHILELECSKSPIMLAGNEEAKGTILLAGKSVDPSQRPGRPSRCEPHKNFIESAVLEGLSGQRIYQDLKIEHGFDGSYDAVKGAKQNLEEAGCGLDPLKGKIVSADTGYFSKVNLEACQDEKVDAYIPDRGFRNRDPQFAEAKRHRRSVDKHKIRYKSKK